MGNNRASRRRYSQLVAGIAVLISLAYGDPTAGAASFLNNCTTYCHGTSPRDGARKGNPHFGSMSSAFIGNHKNHLSAAPSTNDCSICHAPVAATSFGHQNNIIEMAVKLKGYSTVTGRARYDKGVFFNMTSIPNLTNATCSNVNCHFEKKTPVWGASAAATTCETCHGALISPLTLAHPKHIIGLGNTISTCTSCHNNYTGAAAYTHATSAGRAIKVTIGAYAGSNNRYMPSQATGRVTGTCSTVACHGSATLMPWSGTLWSTTNQCGKCHSSNTAGAITQAVPFYGTAYPTKVTLNTNAKVGAHTNHMTSQALGISASTACTDCHGTVTLASATHMTGATNLVWSALATKNGALVPTYTAATGACANTYCHGASMPGGDTSGTNRAPTWINPNYLPATISTAACGLCHGFPPAAASGHPAVTVPAGFPTTTTIGTTCSCHSNINTAGNSYANIFINPALHINGIFEPAASGHVFPFGGSIHLSAAATTPWTSCTGCHANTAGGTYPIAAGSAPNCTGCHIQGLKAPSGTSSCWDCHGVSATDGRPNGNVFPNISGNHRIHVAITGTTCATCHTGGGSGAAAHGPSNRVAATTATVKVAFTGQGTAPLWTLATKTCSATNCHGQGAPAWGARVGAVVNGFPYSSVQCAKCHSGNLAADVNASKPFYSTAIPQVTLNTNAKVGAHTSHLTAPDSLTNAFACADCHGTVTLTAATHMNGTTNLTWSTLATKSGVLVPTFTAGVCANVYCHGASMPGGDISGTNRAPTWTSTTYLPATLGAGGTACKTCHGFPPLPASGHPALTTAVPATFGNGTVAIGASCSCHANISSTGTTYANIFVNKALHINGTVDVSGGHAVPFYAHATPPFTSCTGCHNASAAGTYPAAAAGAAPNCRGCHITADPTVTTTGCASCHASPPSGTAHPNIVGSHAKHGAVACATCHSGAGAGSGAAHGPGNKGTNPAVDNIVFTAAQAGSSATWTAATKTCSTTYCHGANLTGGGTAKSPVWGTTLTGCGTCHGDPPATTTHSGVTVTQCINCHTHVNAAGTGFTNAALHMNGVIDASGGVSSGGSPCYTCHSVYNVMNSSTASFHHVLDAVPPDQAPNTGAYPSSQTVLACVSCHADHNYFNSNKGANLRSTYSAAAGSIDNHDFSTTAPYGLCVSCHSTAQTKGTAQTVAGTTVTITIDGSAAGYQASMHNYTASSLFGTSKFSANCVKCHTDEQAKDKQTSVASREFGTHFSVQRSLLNPMGATPQAAAGADFCYRCHSKTTDVNPGGGAAKSTALKDYFGSKAMTAASEDIFSAMQRGTATVGRHNVSSYKGLHKDTETRADIALVKHVECSDCHDPHLAKAGNHTAGSAALAGVLTGASGVGVTTWGANWAGVTATAYNPSTTTAPLIAATAEWQVCFKCHSGANANVATWGGTAAAAFTDLALEFNPNNASGHPIVTGLNNYPNSPAPKALTAAKMKAPWTNVGTQVMTCSDCHATDSTASKGPHGSSVKWMLTGTNKAWPYTAATANGTSTGTLFRVATYSTGNGTVNGLFCLNCHTITASNSWHSNSNVTGGEHGGNAIMACASCHIRVPHGGKISRLLQTTNAPARYKSNGNGATSSFTQFGPTTGTVKGSTTSSSTFNSSCGEHSGTGGEAW